MTTNTWLDTSSNSLLGQSGPVPLQYIKTILKKITDHIYFSDTVPSHIGLVVVSMYLQYQWVYGKGQSGNLQKSHYSTLGYLQKSKQYFPTQTPRRIPHTPDVFRHIIEVGDKASCGHVPDIPVQFSGTSTVFKYLITYFIRSKDTTKAG